MYSCQSAWTSSSDFSKSYKTNFVFSFVSEENIYLLCKKLSEDGTAKPDGSDLFVVFISNEKNQASECCLILHIEMVDY